MWSLCAMRERRQWWWWGRAPGCKVRNSALGTVLSENLALIGPSSCFHQLPTQICWQVLSVQKQNPCQWWTQVQALRRALWHNPLHRKPWQDTSSQILPLLSQSGRRWDSTLGKGLIVKCIVKIVWIMDLLACRIGLIVVLQEKAFFVFFLIVVRPPPRQPRMKLSKWWTCREMESSNTHCSHRMTYW